MSESNHAVAADAGQPTLTGGWSSQGGGSNSRRFNKLFDGERSWNQPQSRTVHQFLRPILPPQRQGAPKVGRERSRLNSELCPVLPAADCPSRAARRMCRTSTPWAASRRDSRARQWKKSLLKRPGAARPQEKPIGRHSVRYLESGKIVISRDNCVGSLRFKA